MTNEQLDEIEKLADGWHRTGLTQYAEELADNTMTLVKAVREARAEVEKWHLKYDCLKGDADVAVIEMNAAVEFADKAKAEIERLRDAMRQVHALAEKSRADWPRHTAWGALVDIHNITKGLIE